MGVEPFNRHGEYKPMAAVTLENSLHQQKAVLTVHQSHKTGSPSNNNGFTTFPCHHKEFYITVSMEWYVQHF
jgi:hypothetical protein